MYGSSSVLGGHSTANEVDLGDMYAPREIPTLPELDITSTTREIKYTEALLEAQDQLMGEDKNVYIIGLGVPDAKGIFGTTLGLQEKYGEKRVLDMPASENAMTGMCVGSAIMGMRPIMTHQRVDFFFLAMDQLINNAAKWHYMSAGQMKVPLVIRLIMGRGWGQGPQHSQSIHSIVSHIPGLKVVMPSTPHDAKGLMISAVHDENPVLFIEHRWLHVTTGKVPEEMYEVPLGKALVVQPGTDVTIVCISFTNVDALRASRMLETRFGGNLSTEIIDVRTLVPLDEETILQSVRKTQRLLVLDPDWSMCSYATQIISMVAEKAHGVLKQAPRKLTYPYVACPSSWRMSNYFYPTEKDVTTELLLMMGRDVEANELREENLAEKKKNPQDQPCKEFMGPF